MTGVSCAPQSVRGEVERVRVLGGEDDWLGAEHAEILRAKWLGDDVLGLACAAIVARELASVNGIGIERVRDDVSIFFRSHGMPLADGDLPIVATAGDAS